MIKTQPKLNILVPMVALAMLFAIGLLNAMKPGPKDAEPYHVQIKRLAREVPYRIGSWTGVDMELDWSAVRLLKPNAVVKRQYTHEADKGKQVWFALIQCKDARDMGGHYPPECYPANGWIISKAEKYRWQVGDLTIDGVVYRVNRHGISAVGQQNANIIILPDGRFVCDMDDVWEVASDYYRHYYGAAQIQIVTDDRMPRDEFDQLVKLFISTNMPLIEMIRSGGKDLPEYQQP